MSASGEPPSEQALNDDPVRTAGWCSSFVRFSNEHASSVREALRTFVKDYSESQDRAWGDSIPVLQREAREVISNHPHEASYTAILEYQLPLESRRADVVLLAPDAVVVVELKGKDVPFRADIDQAAAYARDLSAYHRDCQSRSVHAVVVPTRSKAPPIRDGDVWIAGPEYLDQLIHDLAPTGEGTLLSCSDFLSSDSYRPLPTIVAAARELLFSREVREVWKARAATDPAVQYIADVAHEAAATGSRHLVLVTGLPGAGKTLVGMRAVHAHYLDDLAVPRKDGKPTAPALYLSGNGPLVDVLQYTLKQAGGGGRTFVRHIKDYLDRHAPTRTLVPEQHLLVFDEAQRAFTEAKVSELHKGWPKGVATSEPEHFVEICGRMPGWSVLVGLIGTGQEIHVGEEGGLGQWRRALESSPLRDKWTVHCPETVRSTFEGSSVAKREAPILHLDTELRFHTATALSDLVGCLLEPGRQLGTANTAAENAIAPDPSRVKGLCLYLTRGLEKGKQYLRDRYLENPSARYGLLASSRDRDLRRFGVDNEWGATKRVRLGPWYAEDESSPHSCRHLSSLVTEFGAQGLELDMALVAWGSDLLRVGGAWDNSRASKYRKGNVKVQDPFQLRINAYRVLLTRGRDGTIVFVPPDPLWNETWDYLLRSGFQELD